MKKVIEANMEVEYKFWAEKLTREAFQARVEHYIGTRKDPHYVVSCDDYYVSDNMKEGFVRYRKGGGQTELTLKVKRDKNVVRKEINLDITGNEDLSVIEFLKLSGYKKLFSVFKEAWIFEFDDCDVCYYTLADGRSVVEVEATKYDDVREGVKIIDIWTEALNLSDLTREQRSLYEIYTQEMEETIMEDLAI